MATERQAVQGLQPVQRSGAPRLAQAPATKVGTPYVDDSGSNFLADLINAGESVMDVGTAIMNQHVEDDKVRQYDRALQGLMPSDDATVGGARAHMLVQLQNDVAAQTLNLKDQAARFEGTDQEWEDLVVKSRGQVQQNLWKQYPGLEQDKESMRTITNAFMEQQPGIFAARATAKLAQEQVKRTQSMNSRIVMATEGLSGQELNDVLQQLQQEALTMQLTKPEFEAMVTDIAMSKASIGDGTMVEATKSLKDANGASLYQRNGKLMTAEIQANRSWAAQNQVELFRMKDKAMTDYENGQLSQEQMLQIIQNHNDVSGGTAWSDGEIQTFFAKVAKQHAADAAQQDLIARGETGSPLGLQDIPEKTRKDYAESITAVYSKMAQDEIERTGATGEDAERIRGQYEQQKYIKLGQQLIRDPNIKGRYDSLMMISSANLKDMKTEPEALQTILRARDTLPEDSRRAVMGDEAYAFSENYDLALRQGFEPGQAIEFAQRASSKDKIPTGVMKDLTKSVEKVVDDVAGGSWMTRGDNMSDLGKDLMSKDAMTIATAMKVAGNNNDTIERHLKATLQSQYTQTAEGFFTQGVLVKGDIRSLGDTIGVNQNDIPMALRQYLNNNKEALLDRSGGMEEKDLYFDVDSKRGLFTIRGGSAGVPLTPAMPMSDLNGQKLLEQRYGEEKKKQADAKKGFEESQMKMWGAGGYKEGMPSKPTAKELGKTGISQYLLSPAYAFSGDFPSNYEFGYKGKNMEFYDYVAKTENSINAGFDRTAGVYTPYDDGRGQSVGFGHFLTPDEKRNGYVTIGTDKVPFVQGRSELTPDRARKLLEQDMDKHKPSTSGWSVPFDDMHPTTQRGLMDLTYNLGKNAIEQNPKAAAAFKSGRMTDGFINMLDTASVDGKRSPGLLARRAQAYNFGTSGSGAPTISEIETREDGSMYVKFSGEMSPAFVAQSTVNKIGADGWLQVYPPSRNSLAPSSKVGKVKVS